MKRIDPDTVAQALGAHRFEPGHDHRVRIAHRRMRELLIVRLYAILWSVSQR